MVVDWVDGEWVGVAYEKLRAGREHDEWQFAPAGFAKDCGAEEVVAEA